MHHRLFLLLILLLGLVPHAAVADGSLGSGLVTQNRPPIQGWAALFQSLSSLSRGGPPRCLWAGHYPSEDLHRVVARRAPSIAPQWLQALLRAATHVHSHTGGHVLTGSDEARSPPKPVIDQFFQKGLHFSPFLPGQDHVHFGKRFLGKEKHHRSLALAVSLSLSLSGPFCSGRNRWRCRLRL